jgi:hypothetical protein
MRNDDNGDPMKYHVEYHADGWQPRAPRYPYAPSHAGFGEVQIVRKDLGDTARLYVELVRRADGSIEVTVARLEVRGNYRGRERYRTAKFLQPADLELVVGPALVPG